MNIIIIGAGEVGRHLAQHLSTEGHAVCVVDEDAALVSDLNDKLDLRAIQGSCISVGLLEEANVADCDLFLAVTGHDATNLNSASIARKLGAKKAIARVHATVQRDEWLFDYREHFGIDYLFSSERLAAVELAKHIRNPDTPVVEEFARGRIELQQVTVSSHSVASGRMLKEISLPVRTRIGQIQRRDRSIVPSATERIEPGDLVTVFGETKKLAAAVTMLQPAFTPGGRRNVIIAGGTESALALAQMLESDNFRIRIMDTDRARCDLSSRLLEKSTVLFGDPTSLDQLREEQAGGADFFVAATADDEDNIMACLQANHLGTRHCLALVHRSDYAGAISRSGRKLGILAAVSPREAARRDLMRFVTLTGFRVVMRLDGGAEVIEFVVKAGGRIDGRQVSEVSWPAGSGLVALLHEDSAHVPAADDVFKPGDTVYAIVDEAGRAEMIRLLGS